MSLWKAKGASGSKTKTTWKRQYGRVCGHESSHSRRRMPRRMGAITVIIRVGQKVSCCRSRKVLRSQKTPPDCSHVSRPAWRRRRSNDTTLSQPCGCTSHDPQHVLYTLWDNTSTRGLTMAVLWLHWRLISWPDLPQTVSAELWDEARRPASNAWRPAE